MNSAVPPRSDPRFKTAIEVPAPTDVAAGVSVVTVIYRTGPVLFEHVASVLKDPDVDQLVLVDNGSTVADAARLREIAAKQPRVLLLQGHGNLGFGRACNYGARRASGGWLLFLNPDAVLRPGVVARLIAARRRRSEAPVIVGGRISNPDGSEQRGGRRGEVTPVSTALTLSRLAARVKRLDRFDIHREHDPAPRRPIELPTISGACFLMSAADYALVDGFDEGYFLHVEDVDLCWRVRRMGGVVLYHPKAEVLHYGHTSMTATIMVEWHKGRGLVRYFGKRADTVGGKAVAWLLGPVIVGACLTRAVLLKLGR